MNKKHVATDPGPGEMGYGCEGCDRRFPTRKDANAHANEQNLIEANAEKAKQERTADAPAAEALGAPEVTKPAQTPPEAPEPAVAAPVTQTKPESPAKGEPQVEFGELTPFDQTRLQVQKYATQLVGSDWGTEFMVNLTVIARNEPRIAKCSPESIVKALKACIDCRIMPNTYAQHAMVAPYWNTRNSTYELQFQLMKNGIVELARRSGEVRTINAELVYEGDEFDVEYGTERKLHHKPNFDVDRTDASKVTHAYMTAVLANGERPFEIVTKSELDKIKRVATAGKKGSPWEDWEPEMQKKTAIKRGAKLLPSSPEMQKAIRYDSLEEAGKLAITPAGELVETNPDGLSDELQSQIAAATSTQDLAGLIRSLPVADQKKAAGAVTAKLKELA